MTFIEITVYETGRKTTDPLSGCPNCKKIFGQFGISICPICKKKQLIDLTEIEDQKTVMVLKD